MIAVGRRLIHGSGMGLYDRDYMRKDSPGVDDDASAAHRLTVRRRRLIIVGIIILLAGFVLALVR